MDNKAMALTVNTFDDLLNMNADMHDSIRRLTVKYADCKSSIRHIYSLRCIFFDTEGCFCSMAEELDSAKRVDM